eukprot:CAMPEP_0176493902 /NCGR_PEP_ID=MMETSP0200_2-20121128/9793_1 /TAXON_ID=947934 /ORGANISM="Chaetoceros sp., Strain GSL56" /LENGTH=243 /DNA_ID=CAMNT_0017891589 /DNA_START=789 /DNA_END=1516 /DNA_ORIENTATION=+
MATADLVVMAFYFLILSGMLSWKRLQQIFPGRRLNMVDCDRTSCEEKTLPRDAKEKLGSKDSFLSGVVAVLISLVVTEISIIFEKRMSRFLPGLGCAAVSVLGISISKILDSITIRETRNSTAITNSVSKFKRHLKKIAGPISQFYFMALFAVLGTSANLSKVATQGVSTFLFATMTLLIHFATLGIGVIPRDEILTTDCQEDQFYVLFPLALEEVLVASNAAIGGASTAACFAGNISEDLID